ncbi:unnamed protein product, partial [Gordionus sp. m RMFG-2023]
QAMFSNLCDLEALSRQRTHIPACYSHSISKLFPVNVPTFQHVIRILSTTKFLNRLRCESGGNPGVLFALHGREIQCASFVEDAIAFYCRVYLKLSSFWSWFLQTVSDLTPTLHFLHTDLGLLILLLD